MIPKHDFNMKLGSFSSISCCSWWKLHRVGRRWYLLSHMWWWAYQATAHMHKSTTSTWREALYKRNWIQRCRMQQWKMSRFFMGWLILKNFKNHFLKNCTMVNLWFRSLSSRLSWSICTNLCRYQKLQSDLLSQFWCILRTHINILDKIIITKHL